MMLVRGRATTAADSLISLGGIITSNENLSQEDLPLEPPLSGRKSSVSIEASVIVIQSIASLVRI